MTLTPELIITLLGIVANAAVTFGVVTTRIEWLRADLRELTRRLERVEHWAFRRGYPGQARAAETEPGDLR